MIDILQQQGKLVISGLLSAKGNMMMHLHWVSIV